MTTAEFMELLDTYGVNHYLDGEEKWALREESPASNSARNRIREAVEKHWRTTE